MGQAPRLNTPQQGSARQGLVPVHDRNGRFSYFMQADAGEKPLASSSSATVAESPFMTFGATEESTPQDDAWLLRRWLRKLVPVRQLGRME